MQKIQLNKEDLEVGQPLQWPVYAQDNELLLDKGQIVQSERQKHILLTRGLFRKPTDEESKTLNNKQRVSLSSPFTVLDVIRQNVSRILQDMNRGQDSDYDHRVTKVASVIQKLCYENADATLGAVMLDQDAVYTQVHPVLCAILTELLLRRKKIPAEDRVLYLSAALTQNIGMLTLQDILSQQESPLTLDQQIAVKKHPAVGCEILKGMGIAHKEWLDTVLNHHERPDGSGYPNALEGDNISLYAKVLSLADIYSAMVLPRKYRDGYFVKKALKDIFIQRTESVDATLAQLLIKELGIYPPGAFVQLANGDTAIVIHRGVKQADAPLVLSILSPRGSPYKNPQRKDTKHKDLYGIIKVIPRVQGLELDKNSIWGLGK